MQEGEAAAVYDLAIVGGGVNGCGIARDATGRGASVVLFEQADLAGATSSASTKLIHGGLRYLEHYAFRLVREALSEREVLWRLAPHLIHPLRFVLPLERGGRPAWMIRLGLFLYDHLAGRTELPGTRTLDLRHDATGAPLRPGFGKAFEYSDCWVDDARLVVLNAMDAAARGASILTRTRVVAARREGALWAIDTAAAGTHLSFRARALVDAAGQWVGGLTELSPRRRLVRGSHIVVPRRFAHDRCYIFQTADGRIVFAIPYEHDFTLIGTTDRDEAAPLAAPRATADEVAYLCAAANDYFREAVTPADVVWSYSGVRALYDDGAARAQDATRDYRLDLTGAAGEAPLLTVYGGKITTYRRLAEAAVAKLAPALPTLRAPIWTARAPLPGGDFPHTGLATLTAALQAAHPGLDAALVRRLASAYGTRAHGLLEGATTPADLGRPFGAGLSEREVRYLMRQEWARTAEDVLWRRSKLGLRFDAAATAALDAYMETVR